MGLVIDGRHPGGDKVERAASCICCILELLEERLPTSERARFRVSSETMLAER